ncbi:uncharacterized protein LOC107008527 isoform X2 [Solanum pennellii]|uniref:Uncharacterized protein LOC107008527 isoform X2 n=1 Tax=Solanum pennellii TaxID=28526 RepID=A0ABM1V509_SOLPN|nr:uncharacterized protein LOC107008527 isoform X2 [Solanum pennellii]
MSGEVQMSSEKQPRRGLSCTRYFDALWFCYSPVHQMQQYYRLGALDNCSKKWSGLVDCLTLKTKRSSEVESCVADLGSNAMVFASNEVAELAISLFGWMLL